MFPYIILVIVALFLCKKVGKNDAYLIPLWMFMSLFIGLRDGVGTDYESYTEIYKSYNFYLEIGFQCIVNFLNEKQCPVWTMFLSFATLTYFFMYAALYKNKNVNKYSSALMLTLCTFSFICNGVRQALAISIFVFATRYIENRKWYVFFPLIIFASLFHTSILICLPLYLLSNKSFKKYLYVIVYMLSFAFTAMDLRSLTTPFMFFIEGSDRYLALLDSDLYSGGYFSLGILVIIINNVILLWLALKTNMEQKYPLWFTLFFFSIVLMNMRVASPLFVRVQVIFGWFVYLLIPKISNSLGKQHRKLFIAYIILYILVTTITYIFDPESKLYPYSFVSLL